MAIPDPVDDRRVAEAAVRGDRDGLAEMYDRYAPYLYDYCRFLLRDVAGAESPEAAADATQDLLVAAWTHLGRLRDPERLRAWLYALARAQCLARPAEAGGGFMAGPEPATGAPGSADAASPAPEAGNAGMRGLTARALDGLDEHDREVLDLAFRHDIGRRDLAAVLGTSEEEAHGRVTGARARFQGGLAALMAPGGPQEQHSTANLLADLPFAAPPAVLRDRVLHAALDPELASHRAQVPVPSFDGRGFPIQPGGRPRGSRRWILVAAAAILAVSAVGAAGGGLLMSRSGEDAGPPTGTSSLGSPSAMPSLPGGDSALAPIPAASSGEPSPTAEETAGPDAGPREQRPQPRPTGDGGRTEDSSPEDEPARLTVSPGRVNLGSGSSGDVYLAAKGGAVMWGSTPSSDAISVSPGSGAIPAGGRVTVTIGLDRASAPGSGQAVVRFATIRGQLQTVTVVWS